MRSDLAVKGNAKSKHTGIVRASGVRSCLDLMRLLAYSAAPPSVRGRQHYAHSGGGRPAVAYGSPDVICQTQTPAAAGADATADSDAIRLRRDGVAHPRHRCGGLTTAPR